MALEWDTVSFDELPEPGETQPVFFFKDRPYQRCAWSYAKFMREEGGTFVVDWSAGERYFYRDWQVQIARKREEVQAGRTQASAS